MKKNNIILYLLIISTFVISCATDDDELIKPESNITSICSEDFTNNNINSSYCIYGEQYVNPNDTFSYTFESSKTNISVTWEVEGSIIIENVIEDIDNDWKVSVATLKFNKDFNGGFVKAIGGENVIMELEILNTNTAN